MRATGSSERFLDDLARALAQPMPRRRALRLLGTSLAAVLVPGVAPRMARAALASPSDGRCGPEQKQCSYDHDNSYLTPVENYCCGPPYNRYSCGSYVAPICHDDCSGAGPNPIPCLSTERDAGGHPKFQCCAGQIGERCVNGKCVDCPSGRVTCAGNCCPSGFRCCPPTRGMPKARCYDPTKQCCTPVAGVVAKWPIRNVDDCPNRVGKKNHKPRANGCGPENGIKVPDRPFVADFKPACDFHDICYETCGRKKSFCDRRFRKLMEDACDETFPREAKRLACYVAAGTYYQFVSKFGDDPYEDAQKEACLCC